MDVRRWSVDAVVRLDVDVVAEVVRFLRCSLCCSLVALLCCRLRCVRAAETPSSRCVRCDFQAVE